MEPIFSILASGKSIPKELLFPPGDDVPSWSILVIKPDGKILNYTSISNLPVELEPQIVAMGSGGDIAIGAMEFGATAMEAVACAIRRDAFSGGNIHHMKLGDFKPIKQRKSKKNG